MVFLTILYRVAHSSHIYTIVPSVPLTPSANTKHSGQFYIFVPSVFVVPSVSTKTLGTFFTECSSTEGDTRHNPSLPSKPCDGTKYILSVLLSRVFMNHLVKIHFAECFVSNECCGKVSQGDMYRVCCLECCTRDNVYRVFFNLYRVFLALGTVRFW
jgi:hypothetical protein